MQNFVLRGARERFDRGELFQEAIVIGKHRGDARLLQHHLGDPDAVRIAAGAPGKIALMRAEPGEQAALEAFQGAGSEEGVHRGDIVARIAETPLRYSRSTKRKYEEDHRPVGMVRCGRAVRMILKISLSLASSSRNAPPVAEVSAWIVASSRSVS